MRSVVNDDAVVFKELVGSSSPEGVNEALSEAVINRGNVEIVKTIFESNLGFNASSLLDFAEEGEQKSLFYIAAAKGHANLVSELLNDNNAENELDDAFSIAVEKGHANVVSKLISKMGNVDDYLKLAIQKPEINGEIVEILLSGQLSNKTVNKVFLQLVSREDENMLKVFIDSKHPGLNIENARQEAGKLGKTKSLEILNAPTDAPVITTTFHL